MKKITLLFLMVLFSGLIYANPVLENTARQVALNWYNYNTNGVKSTEIVNFEAYKYQSQTTFYIYNFKDGGFVIVSADDAALPILGYSVENKLRDNRVNQALEDWLLAYAMQINKIVAAKLDNSQTIAEWNKILNNEFPKDGKAVLPLVQTTWDQMSGYDTYCPTGTPTGCVATSCAQILKYHEYPASGFYQHSYVHPTYGLQSANFKSTTYNWANMPLNNGNDDVAILMYHLGVAVDMDYAPDGSGSQTEYLVYVLPNYFGYDHQIKYADMASYTATDWKNLLKAQLDNNLPMVYSGYSAASGGHAFVCDGYNASDQFHFNWGWSGYGDGYFAIGSLNPVGMNFNENNAVVYDINPPSGEATFFAVKKFSDLSNVTANTSPYITYIDAVNDYVAWGIAADGSGSGADYRSYTKTTDGGLTWEAKTISNLGGTAFSNICGVNDQIAYIAMWGANQANNKVLRTLDGGTTWTVCKTGAHSASFFNVVHFFDANNGLVQGDPDTEFEIHVTTDGGNNWTRVAGANIPNPVAGEFGIVGKYTAIGDTIWFTTNKGRIYKSEDKGLNWTVATIYSTTQTTYIDVEFSDNGQTGIALVAISNGTSITGYQYYKTSDGGATWTQITSPTGNFYNSGITAIPGVDSAFISVGSDYQTPKMGISYSEDGGNTWVELADYYKGFQFVSIDMASPNKGFIGTFAGEYTDGVWVFGDLEPLFSAFSANDTTTCINTDVVFTSTSTGDITDYDWDFGADATPATATGIGPHTVQYTTAGYKTVSLTVSNSSTSDIKTIDNYINVAGTAPVDIDTVYGPRQILPLGTGVYSVVPQSNTDFVWAAGSGLVQFLTNHNDTVNIKFPSFLNTYNLTVYAINGCGTTTTYPFSVQVTNNILINDVNANFSITPNPAVDFINVVSSDIIKNVTITSINGKVVYSENINKNDSKIDVNNLESGMYLVSVTTENGTSTQKIIVK